MDQTQTSQEREKVAENEKDKYRERKRRNQDERGEVVAIINKKFLHPNVNIHLCASVPFPTKTPKTSRCKIT